MEFELIQELIDKDQLVAAERMLDDLIADSSRQLSSLETREMKLNKEFKTWQKKISESQKLNQQLSENKSQPPDFADDENNKGSYFVQLRRVEAEIERCKMNIEGMNSVINNLKGEISKNSAKGSRLVTKVNEIRSQYETVKADETAKKTELNNLTNILNETTSTRNLLEDEVEELKAKLGDFVKQMKEVSPEERSFLITQRDILEREVKEKLKLLEDRKNKEKVLTTKSQITRTRKNRKSTAIMSTSSWLNEREALIGRIKNLRVTLKGLETQQRGVEKANAKRQEIVSEGNFNQDEVKYSLIAERLMVPTKLNDFFLQAMELEKARTEKLKAKLAKIAKVSGRISEFTASISPFTNLDDCVVENTARITLLKEELSSIREKIRK